jgi:hypothetical protein
MDWVPRPWNHKFDMGAYEYVYSVGMPITNLQQSHMRYYSVSGNLKPRHRAYTYPVRIYRWKKTSSGHWKRYGDPLKAKATDCDWYSTYSMSIRLPSAGRWRLRAYAVADSEHRGKWSTSYRYVTVK